MQQSLSTDLQLALDILHKAGHVLREGFSNTHQISLKGAVDLVTEMDLASETLLRNELGRVFPDIAFYGEESGGGDWERGRCWVVDPLDGTTNFAHGLDHFSISLALCEDGQPVMGLVHRPMSGETYHAVRGQGAFRDSTPLRVSSVDTLREALIATGFPYQRTEVMDRLLLRLRRMLTEVRGVRRFGSAALDLCAVAAGTFAVYYETGLKPWDVAAGKLIVEEAGGKVTDFRGQTMSLGQQELLASNVLLHDAAQRLLEDTAG